jgi:hypothetical protein
MHPNGHLLFCTALTIIFALGGTYSSGAENEQRVLATSRSGELRVEQRGAEYWMVSVKNSASANRIPVESPDAAPVEIHFSPNEEWFFTLPAGMSCRREGSLYHRNPASGEIAALKAFNAMAWAQAAKLRALSQDFVAAEACRMMRFTGWSLDSSRLLVALRGGQSKFDMEGAYLYFHTGAKRWELTPYLERVNKGSSDILREPMPCCEPAGALPPEAQLKGAT